jgi:hypothetical protein
MLATCRVEACSSTLRHLGLAFISDQSIAFDDERLYWLDASGKSSDDQIVGIRSAPRLLTAP